jgi:hypothetical protein
MSTTLRSLIAVSFLCAGITGLTGCAAEDDCADETPEEHAAHTQDQNDEASQVKVEENKLAVQKKGDGDLVSRPSRK